MKIYHLSSCNTCQRVIKEIDHETKFSYQEIKSDPITAQQLDELKAKVGSYEALFSRRAMKYRSMNLKEQQLSEADYRRLILDEYTFLKRPVVLVGDDIFIGSTKKTIAAAKKRLETIST